jgi:hypothetical protein
METLALKKTATVPTRYPIVAIDIVFVFVIP